VIAVSRFSIFWKTYSISVTGTGTGMIYGHLVQIPDFLDPAQKLGKHLGQNFWTNQTEFL
jgi:hypothetical protein